MQTRFLVLLIVLIMFTACQTGRIPCPKVKADKLRKSVVKRNFRYMERNTTTASIQREETTTRRTNLIRIPESHPPLEHINVEEWDCPKPGVKRTVPKAVKDNIKKNKKAYETYYKSRNAADTVQMSRGRGGR
jgi:hypothetical protein